ncbi:hypothetical protein [Streptacidiphilus cavernicola]|uniref:Uncharacterized protein n=1 Tax=Streptacidiphilus cavernicola TaxID=3342716 RepID=A0ABV6VPD6_9ACTN
MSPAPDERDRIRAAMDRILAGAPERSNGALTIVALAIEADFPRNALTQRHLDLKNEFYKRVKIQGGTSEVETRLHTKIVTLKTTIANKNAEIARLKDDVNGFLAENTRLTLENQELRDVLSGTAANVTPLRSGPGR